MTVQEVANRLVELCRRGEFETAIKELYGQDIISIEPQGAPMERVEGLEGVIQKAEHFNSMVEEHYGIEVSDPLVADNYFSVTMSMDVKMKGAPRMDMEEICVYGVKDGKITLEQFFYTVPPNS